MTASRVIAAEFLGTLLLLAIVVGSGIMGERLALGNVAVALLAIAAATAAGLYVLIMLFAPISGAHFNPAVTLGMRLRGESLPAPVLGYLLAQIVGALAGVLLAHAMFASALWQPGIHMRTGPSQWLSEGVATFGLVLTIIVGSRTQPRLVPALVALWIFAAYWFTASKSFANPAVTIARRVTQTFAGIRPQDAPWFIAAQLIGAIAASAIAVLFLAPDVEGSATTTR
jgi:glycerol uptake facilitator-like aquaporin